MEDIIKNLYFDEKMKQKDIANKLNISKAKVTRTIKMDSRYIEEKNSRKEITKIKHNKDIQKRVETKRKISQFNKNSDDLILKQMHNQASSELSGRKTLSNESYRKWNYSAYNYNPSKERFEFKENLGRSYDVPKYIKVKKY
ncbi:MAG: hypothetical protein Q4G09_05990 [Clostridia bacterium]|nr:hypothetical protein [Clostridia bacterium]